MAQLLRDGLVITVVGMGLVFGALAVLWGVMALLQRVLPEGRKPFSGLRRTLQKTPRPAGATPTVRSAVGPEGGPTAAEMAAIVVALARWREQDAAKESIGWRLRPLLTRWLAVGRSRQVQSWTPRR